MKAALKIVSGKVLQMFQISEMNLVLLGHRSISVAIRENSLELKSKRQGGS